MSTPSESSIRISAYAATDVGRQRQANQDQWLILDLTTGARGLLAEALEHTVGPQGTLLAVSDGLGGAPGGELASSLAMESLLRDLKGQLGGDDPVARYQQAVLRANRWVWEVAQTDVDLHGMGATLTTALIHRGRAYVAQVGDSRGYLLRGSTLYQMTEDQSLIGALVMMGELSARQAREAEGRNIMLQALGPQPDIQLAITELALQDGDLLILCTDGLFNQVPPNEISHVALASPSLRSCCEELIGRANDRGGPDNITIVTARVTGTGLREKSPEDDDHASFHRLKTFDPTEVLRRHPDLTEFATARARTARRRGRLLLGLIILFVLLLLIMASR